MASIYVHVPFCQQACYYCDFHFSTNTALQSVLVEALCTEVALQKDYLGTQTLQSIYLGGGTPSLLTEPQLQQIFETIHTYFALVPQAEVTLEANPDDINASKLALWQKVGINRLSIGVQSFNEKNLQFLHRTHNALTAKKSILQAQDAGFSNLSLDLMYALPSSSLAIWEVDITTALSLQVPHISAYCLTIEEKTVFGKWLKQKKMQEVEEEQAKQQFEILIQQLTEAGFWHYEISNFALPNALARHNSSYWQQKPYLGIGASAHSFNGRSRQYNIANNSLYIKQIQEGKVPYQALEMLSTNDQVNEYILTSLRTMWGCDTAYITQQWHYDLRTRRKDKLAQLIDLQLIKEKENTLILSHEGKFVADKIAMELFC